MAPGSLRRSRASYLYSLDLTAPALFKFEGPGRTVNASGADQVLYRLRSANIVRQMQDGWRAQGGRPANLWEVNPALTHTEGPAERAET